MRRIALLFVACISIIQPATAQQANTFTIATYNIRYNNPADGPNAWPQRKENVKALIRFHDFDIFGTQEGLIDQIKGIAELSEFAYTGKGRDDGKEAGEHSAIFFKKDRFRLLQSGDFWLSETPEKPGKGWDAVCCNRICSWGKFKDLRTKKDFYFFSVHFDHQGVIARRESAKLMVRKIKEIAGKNTVICVGDFNATPESQPIQDMAALLEDAFHVSETPPYGPVGTTNSFQFDAPMKSRIDYIFVTPNVKVLKYGVLTDAKDQRYPSDHLPVMVKAIMK